MRTVRMAAAVAALLGSVLLLAAAAEAQNATPGIPGYFDPRANFPDAGSGKQVTGSITVTTNVAIDAALQKVPDQTITCSVTIGTGDTVATNSASGSNNVIRAGSRGTCTTTINFIWEVAPTTKTMSVTIFVTTGSSSTDQVSHTASASTSVPLTTKKVTFTLAL